MNFCRPLTLSFAVLALSGTAFARDRAQARHEVRQRISDEIVNKLATTTGLDAAETAKVKTIVDKYGLQLEAQEQALVQARHQIRQLVSSRSNDVTAINQAIDAFQNARVQHEQIVEARSKELRAAVTPAQYAMGLLERPRIEKEVRQQLLHAAGKDGDE